MAAASFVADLRAAREAAGVSIDAIQLETRIPADVVRRLEDGALLDDPSFNEVYIRALLRSYASAVGLAPNAVLEAYTVAKAGAYRGQLRPDYVEEKPAAPGEGEAALPPAPTSPADAPKPPAPAEEIAGPPASAPAPAVAALSKPPEPEPPHRHPDAPNEHFTKRRVPSPSALKAPRSFDRSWGIILGATGAVVLAVVVVLWLLFRTDAPEPDETALAAAGDTAEVAASDSLAGDTTLASTDVPPAPRLQLPIRVTVRAGGDGLQNFRVTEEPDARRPYWVEPGDALAFESAQGVILWGEEAGGMSPEEVTLVWQGFEWNPAPGRVLRITTETGQRLLDSLHAARYRAGQGANPR